MPQETLPEKIVIFDGVCNLCEFSVNFIYERDRSQKFTFTPAQSPLGKTLLERHMINTGQLDTVVLVDGQKAYTRSTAALKIAAELDPPWDSLRFLSFIPQPVRDLMYDLVAGYRYNLFGKKESCMIPGPELKARFLEEIPK